MRPEYSRRFVSSTVWKLVGETMRAVLNELATVAPEWLPVIAPDEWYVRYERSVETYRLPTSKVKQDAYAQQVGEDATTY